MFSHSFYNVVHLIGIALVVSALGGTAVHAISGGTKQTNRARGLQAALHGVGALLILVGGFGMLARLGFQHGGAFPNWLLVKLGVWVTAAALLFIPYRKPALAKPIYLAVPVLVGLATYMAVYKPI